MRPASCATAASAASHQQPTCSSRHHPHAPGSLRILVSTKPPGRLDSGAWAARGTVGAGPPTEGALSPPNVLRGSDSRLADAAAGYRTSWPVPWGRSRPPRQGKGHQPLPVKQCRRPRERRGPAGVGRARRTRASDASRPVSSPAPAHRPRGGADGPAVEGIDQRRPASSPPAAGCTPVA